MHPSDYVDSLIADLKSKGVPLSEVAWQAALACVGWPYVFAARGEYCTPRNRRDRYSSEHPTIKTACQNFSGEKTCSGCKWYPDGKKVRCFDCRGFTYWILLQAFGFKLSGGGATTQWKTASNWKAKGEIKDMPKNTLCCLFVQKGEKMEHTGFGLNQQTIECGAGVQHYTQRKAKWTHWAIPACVNDQIDPGPDPEPAEKPTLRRGDRGEWVTLAQTQLIQKGYRCGDTGADGVFGTQTEKAVKRFQQDAGLKPDGIIGPLTWAALGNQTVLYTVTIPHLPKYHADALVTNYSGAYMTEEGK